MTPYNPDTDVRELAKWLNEEPNRSLNRPALARVLAYLHTPMIKPTHQAAYDYAQAAITQSAGEAMLDQALRTLGSDNQIIDLCEPVLVAYRKLLTQTIGQPLMDWLDWWMYGTEHGTKPMHFNIDGVDYNPQDMTLYRFLEIIDAN